MSDNKLGRRIAARRNVPEMAFVVSPDMLPNCHWSECVFAMLPAGAPCPDRRELMGHSVGSVRGREVYGDDMTLDRKLEVGLQIALPVPEHPT